jgi:rsbT co-antagonist protein RsbR
MSELADIIARNEEQIRTEWLRDMAKSLQRGDLMSKTELDEQSKALLLSVVKGVKSDSNDLSGPGWGGARELLQQISASRARQGFSPVEVATFVLSLKQPIFSAVRRDLVKSPDKLFDTVWSATELLDRLALTTTKPS